MAAKKGRPTDERLKENLEYMALAISRQVHNAFSSAVIQFAAGGYFIKHGEKLFAMNPANTLPHTAVRALEDQSVLELYETFTTTKYYSPIEFRGKEVEILRQHRDLIGHPAKIDWGSDHKQKFFRENSNSHVKCGLIWDIAKKLDKALVAQGSEPCLANIPVNREMAETLNLILRLSVKPEVVHAVPTVDHLVAFLESQRPGIIKVLETYPEGKLVERRHDGKVRKTKEDFGDDIENGD